MRGRLSGGAAGRARLHRHSRFGLFAVRIGLQVPRTVASVIMWSVHPLRQFPVRAVMAALLIMALGFAIGGAAGDWIWGSISMVILFAATIRFWMRSTFLVDGTRVRAVFPLGTADVRWPDVQSARLAPRGMLLSMRAGTRPRTLAIDFAGLDDVKVMEIRTIVRENVGEVESAVPISPGTLREGAGQPSHEAARATSAGVPHE